MNNPSLKCYPAIILLSMSCNSNASAVDERTQYTYLKDCKEQIANDNAAFSEVRCPKVGSYDVLIKKQSPQFVAISLFVRGRSLVTNFNPLTQELPIEHGTAIEWRLEAGEPRYMIFRLAWGTSATPFTMKERLVVGLVDKDRICPLAVIRTAAVRNANQMARDLLGGELSTVRACPDNVVEYPRNSETPGPKNSFR